MDALLYRDGKKIVETTAVEQGMYWGYSSEEGNVNPKP